MKLDDTSNDKFESMMRYDKFVGGLVDELELISRFVSFMKLEEGDKESVEDAINVINKKIKKMKNAKSLKEAKKYVKVKRLVGKVRIK